VSARRRSQTLQGRHVPKASTHGGTVKVVRVQVSPEAGVRQANTAPSCCRPLRHSWFQNFGQVSLS